MKKLFLLLAGVFVLTACDDEQIDTDALYQQFGPYYELVASFDAETIDHEQLMYDLQHAAMMEKKYVQWSFTANCWEDDSVLDGLSFYHYILFEEPLAYECIKSVYYAFFPFHREASWGYDIESNTLKLNGTRYRIAYYKSPCIILYRASYENDVLTFQSYTEYLFDYDREGRLDYFKMTYEEAKAASDEYAKEWEENHPPLVP